MPRHQRQFSNTRDRLPLGSQHLVGLTLVELLVVIGVIGVLASLILVVSSHVQNSATTIHCTNSLRGIGQAIVLYENSNGSMPLGNLPVALNPYSGNRMLYNCPRDSDRSADSYSPFYVFRTEEDTRNIMVACNRHDEGEKGVFLYGMSAAKTHSLSTAYTEDSQKVVWGKKIKKGTISFADTSSAEIQSGELMVLSSFYNNGGRLNTLVRIMQKKESKIKNTVNSGSHYEIITPAATAAALGTRYTIETDSTSDTVITKLNVTEGTVAFRSRLPRARAAGIGVGASSTLEIPSVKAPTDPDGDDDDD